MNNKLKNDRYRKARGGKAFFVEVFCGKCSALLLLYQKDGDGALKRCYFNRIFAPEYIEKLQYSAGVKEPQDAPPLECGECKTVIGMPIRHHDGRLAFRLRPGFFTKRRVTRERG